MYAQRSSVFLTSLSVTKNCAFDLFVQWIHLLSYRSMCFSKIIFKLFVNSSFSVGKGGTLTRSNSFWIPSCRRMTRWNCSFVALKLQKREWTWSNVAQSRWRTQKIKPWGLCTNELADELTCYPGRPADPYREAESDTWSPASDHSATSREDPTLSARRQLNSQLCCGCCF